MSKKRTVVRPNPTRVTYGPFGTYGKPPKRSWLWRLFDWMSRGGFPGG